MTGAYVAQRPFEEVRAAVEDDRGRQQQGGPAQGDEEALRQVEIELGPRRHGGHHHLHPQQTGDTELAQRAAILVGQAFSGLIGAVGMSGVANATKLGQQLAERQLRVAQRTFSRWLTG